MEGKSDMSKQMQSLLGKIGKKRLRATFSFAQELTGAGANARVDEEAGVIYGVQVCLEGAASGHGVWLGADFIGDVSAQGNALQSGVKVRFGHPAMCADALGTFLGRASNFQVRNVTRKDGSVASGAFADIKLADEAHNGPGGRDIYAWTLAAAKNNPDTFGQSIVFTYKDFYVVDKDGGKHLWSEEPKINADKYDEVRYSNWKSKSADGKKYAVMDKLHGTDFTDTPAATDGVFDSADPDTLAQEAADILDAHPRILSALADRPDTVAEFIERFNAVLTASGKPPIRLAAQGESECAACASWATRFSGMQSAKDTALGVLQGEHDNVKNALDTANASLADTKAQLHSLDIEMATLRSNLEKAQADLSIANNAKAALETDLADTRKQLEQAEKNHAGLVGGVMKHTPAGGYTTWKEARDALGYEAARKAYPDLYDTFMKL